MANEGLDELMARMARTKRPAPQLPGRGRLDRWQRGAGRLYARRFQQRGAVGRGAAASRRPGPIEEELFMYNWSDYVAPENMEAFKAEFGVKNFVYDTFANNEELLAKLAGRRVRLRLRLPDGRVHAADGRRGLHPEAGLQPHPEHASTSIRPC